MFVHYIRPLGPREEFLRSCVCPKVWCLKDVTSRPMGSRLFKAYVTRKNECHDRGNEGISLNVIVRNLHFIMSLNGSY